MRLGTTTFSFTNEWLTRRFTLVRLLERGGARPASRSSGTRSGVAIRRCRATTCSSSAASATGTGSSRPRSELRRPRARRRSVVTADEAVELLEAQVETARLLGFPVLRLHAGIPVTRAGAVAPLAERHGVVLATEVQGGQAPDHPAVAAVLESRDRLDSPATSRSTSASRCARFPRASPTRSAGSGRRGGRRRADRPVGERGADAGAVRRDRRAAFRRRRSTRRARDSSASDARTPAPGRRSSRRSPTRTRSSGSSTTRATTSSAPPSSSRCSPRAATAASSHPSADRRGSTPTRPTRSSSSATSRAVRSAAGRRRGIGRPQPERASRRRIEERAKVTITTNPRRSGQ